MESAPIIDRLRQTRRETLARLAPLDPARLEEERGWRGAPTTVRQRLLWLAEGDDARVERIRGVREQLGTPLSGAQQALVQGGAARGRLLGTLIGLSDDQFDWPPTAGEWSVRRTLGHVIATDTRYRIAVEYALERARSGRGGPLRPPEDFLPARDGAAESAGSRQDVLDRLTSARDAVLRSLSSTPDDLLEAPTNWIAWDLDVRFRLHRFAAHDREHTIQIRKTLQALGVTPNEPQMLLADAQAARGALEALLLCTPASLLGQAPPGGGPTIAMIAEESLADEQDL
jgi:uncharacterized damage-inducible protein DinB